MSLYLTREMKITITLCKMVGEHEGLLQIRVQSNLTPRHIAALEMIFVNSKPHFKPLVLQSRIWSSQ